MSDAGQSKTVAVVRTSSARSQAVPAASTAFRRPEALCVGLGLIAAAFQAVALRTFRHGRDMKRILALTGSVLLICAAGCGDSKPSAQADPPANNKPTDKPPSPSPAPRENSPAKSGVTDTSPPVSHVDPPRGEPPVDKSALGQAVAQLAAADEAAQQQAALTLSEAGSSAVPALLSGLKDNSPDVRRAVAYFLLESFPATDSRISAAFRDALADDDRKVRHFALQAVKRMPPEAIALAVPKLAGLLDSSREEPINRAEAARLLGKLQSEARDALPALIKTATSDPSEKVRAPALYSVTRIAAAEQVLPILVQALEGDKDGGVRLVAASGLGRMGPSAASAAGSLAAALDDRDEKVRRAASDALAELASASVQPLVSQLEAVNPRTRELAIFTLGRLGPLAKPALPAIEMRTKDEDAKVRMLAESVAAALREQ